MDEAIWPMAMANQSEALSIWMLPMLPPFF
jgi:hypothetical protein